MNNTNWNNFKLLTAETFIIAVLEVPVIWFIRMKFIFAELHHLLYFHCLRVKNWYSKLLAFC